MVDKVLHRGIAPNQNNDVFVSCVQMSVVDNIQDLGKEGGASRQGDVCQESRRRWPRAAQGQVTYRSTANRLFLRFVVIVRVGVVAGDSVESSGAGVAGAGRKWPPAAW